MTRRIFLIAGLLLLAAGLSFSQTVWQKYEGNPILVPTEGWESPYGVLSPRVLKIGNIYKMWYGGLSINRQIGLATSDDGIHWTKFGANPVLGPGLAGAFDSQHVSYCVVLFHNNQYWMWYSGYNGQVWQIGLATSPDGMLWTKSSYYPVLPVGDGAAWDAGGVYNPTVIFDGQSFKMWYNGVGSVYESAVGYAESPDGIHWEKSPQPVIKPTPGTWYSQATGMVAVLLTGGTYQAWYGGRVDQTTASIGYATSHNGVEWEFYSGNPVLTPGGNNPWDSATLSGGWVLLENKVYKLWYGGRSDQVWKIGYAVSSGCQGIPLPASEAYGNINADNSSHPDKVTYCLKGQADDRYLSFEAYDIDTNYEVDVLLNGVKIFDSPLTANNSWSGLLGVLLPDELINDLANNELVFDNIKNPPQSLIWGVRRVSVDPFYPLPSTAEYGKIPGGDEAHADKVVYFFSGRPGDMNLFYEVYDIDNVDELDVLLNGAKVHDEPTTANNTWSRSRKLLLPDALVNDAGLNVLIFDSPGNPPQQWYWGVRNVQVAATQDASIALNLSQSLIAEASRSRDGRYLFDGRSTPPARSETDDNAAIEGATTIAPNGYLVVDLQAVRQFDYLQLYPEWNTKRYFVYRIDVSQNGKDWQTLIDKSASFVHGIQLEELPTTQARFLRVRGASVMADVDALPTAGLSEEAYWQMHDDLINRADSTDLAIAELALFQKQTEVSVASDPNSPPVLYDLAQNFPNPFNPATTIRFALPRSAKVNLVVYGLRGEIVRTLVDEELPAGFHTRTFDTTGLASGIYFYQLQAGDFTATRKMVLTK